MSQTFSIGTAGAAQWAYVAAVMEECLDGIAGSRKIEPGKIPKGILDGASRFFASVIEATGENVPNFPMASLTNYDVAVKAARGAMAFAEKEQTALDSDFREYLNFMKSLDTQRTLSDKEVALTKQLRDFFRHLLASGESEIYEKRVRLKPPPDLSE